MKKRHLYTILGIGLLLSSIFPIRYYFAEKESTYLPVHASYQQAVCVGLRRAVQQQAEQHNCKNYILPVQRVQGAPKNLPNLTQDVNLALSAYTGWHVLVNLALKRQMMKREEEVIAQWGSVMECEDFMQMIQVQRNRARNTDYSSSAKCSPLESATGNDYQLVLTVYDEKKKSVLFNIRQEFAHPLTVQSWMQKNAIKQQNLKELERSARAGRYGVYGFGGLLVLYSLVLLSIRMSAARQRRMHIADIATQILNRQELVDNGHFVAALELADKYLHYFPDDSEIVAFRERLLDVTNDDPKKAQQAYVEARKLQLRLQNPAAAGYLTAEEKQSLTALLPYHPELKSSYTALIACEEEDLKKTEFQKQYQQVAQLKDEKRWSAAFVKLDALKLLQREEALVAALSEEIQRAINQTREAVAAIEDDLDAQPLDALLARLEEVLKSHVDYQPALNLRQRLNKPLKKGVVLTAPAEIPIYVFSQQQVILGRRDAGVPVDIAIDSRYVSRPHLTLTIEHDKIVLEDMKSTGGSYYNGEQFTTTGIQHDATITLGKVVDIELTLQHQGSSISGVEICEGEHQWFVVSRRVELASRHITITNNQGVLLLRSAQGVSILDGTEEIVLAGCTYRVEPVQEV